MIHCFQFKLRNMNNMKLKRSIATLGIQDFKIDDSFIGTYIPQNGDVAVFEVIEQGKHASVQGVNELNVHILPDDHLLAVFGNRYATEQFEGYVPDRVMHEYQLLGKGGVVGRLESMHDKFELVGPTRLKLIGYAMDHKGQVMNTIYHNKKRIPFSPGFTPPWTTTVSLGSSMDSGKTTTAAFYARQLMYEGKNVAYMKLTGTTYTKDLHFVGDCGAEFIIDFSFAGYPSTYLLSLDELMDLYAYLNHKISEVKPDHVIIEIADGLYQRETAMLIQHAPFMKTISQVLFSAGDSLSAIQGIEYLKKLGVIPIALSGVFTRSPLLVKEVQKFTDIPVKRIEDFVLGHSIKLTDTVDEYEAKFDVG